MITKKDLQEYGFRGVVDYFRFILDTLQSGNKSDFPDLYNDMNREQKAEFMTYLLALMAKDNEGLSNRDDYQLLIKCIQFKNA